MFKIYDSLAKKKCDFIPRKEKEITLYVCGITAYDYCHIGHARSNAVFDTLVRYLEFSGYKVYHVRNITDIDDKIIHRAAENGESIDSLTARFIDFMHEDFDRINIRKPHAEPRATQYIPEMIRLIQSLEEKGYAYQGETGDVYFRVQHFDGYGKLSHKTLDALQTAVRIPLMDDKESPLDFVLWKPAKPGEPSWGSPWGEGRPGWHIECSAMSMHLLGQTFDIHGGGNDLKFPHHENEIAQSEAVTGQTFARYWMHNGMVTINKEKMSKSLGNFFTLREVLEAYHPEIIRYFLISSHYRSPLNYSLESLRVAKQAINRLYTSLRGLLSDEVENLDLSSFQVLLSSFQTRFAVAMDDDLNTPAALAVLFEMTHEINTAKQNNNLAFARALAEKLRELANLLGILYETPDSYLSFNVEITAAFREEIDNLIAERLVARKEKDWQKADEIRTRLQEKGVVLEDGADGTEWRLLAKEAKTD